MPNLKELVDQLNAIRDAVKAAKVEDDQTIDLEILAAHIEQKIEMSAFDPLAAIPGIAVPDFTKLQGLSKELKAEIENERKRSEILGKILSSAKSVLSLTGVPLP